MRQLLDPMFDEIVFLEHRMSELKKLPAIIYDPKNPAFQKATPAGKQYKECSQSYAGMIRTLANILKQSEPSAADDLIERLKEFEM